MKTGKKAPKPYWEMNKDELAEATREFDRELHPDDFQALGREKSRIWQRLQKKEASRRADTLQVCSKNDLRELRDRIGKAAAGLVQQLNGLAVAKPVDILKILKLDPLGFDPYEPSQKMNLVEQINQSATLLVACAAVEGLLRKHPSRTGYMISRPTSKGYDLYALDASVAADVFAAIWPGGNDKISNDLKAVLKNKEPFSENCPPQHRYIFFVSRTSRGFPPPKCSLQGPHRDAVFGTVWYLIEDGRRSVTIVPLAEDLVFSDR
jgi:hypothetical protein